MYPNPNQGQNQPFNQNMQNPNMPPQQFNPNMQNPNMPPQQYNPNMQQPPQQYNPNMQNPNMVPAFIPHKQKIMQLSGVFIKQDFSLMEVIGGCEVENKYKIYAKKPGKTKKTGKKLYKAKEKSGCLSRNCLSGACRPMDIKIKNMTNLEDDPTSLRIHKPCTCTYLCLNRPTIFVDYSEDGQETNIGKIVDIFNCCNYDFSIYDSNGEKMFRITADCCQCGIWCKGCGGCGPCEKVDFKVLDKNGKEISKIQKKNKDCLKSMLTDADNFGVDFTPNMTWEERSLLMCAALFIDYMMFEEKGNGQESLG